MDNKVSIIIVARNEESEIAACIKAAQAAAGEIGGAEIIVSDSASTDKTADIALEMGAKVLRLKPEWELSASAGRYIGTHYAKGDYLLFIDADTLVYRGFLPQAIELLNSNKKLAGVSGHLDDTEKRSQKILVLEDRFEKIRNTNWLRGGCCFYRRSAVLEVGSFNPYLLTEEEADIGLRLTRAGWNLQMLPIPMAVHTRCTEDLSIGSIFSHLTRNLFSGRFGGTMRTVGYAFKNGYGLQFCWLRMPTMIFFAVWFLMTALLALLPTSFLHVISLGFFLLGFLIILLKKRSITKTLLFFLAKLMYFVNLILGIPKLKFTATESYPLDVEIIENEKPKQTFNKNLQLQYS